MRVILILSVVLISCGETINSEGVLERWPSGVIKKERTHLSIDTFKVNHYHEDFKLYMTGNAFYLVGKEVKHGTWKSFYPDGRMWSLSNWNLGIEDGEYKTWHTNGNLNISGFYSNGVRTGKWTFYNTDGEVVKEYDSTPLN